MTLQEAKTLALQQVKVTHRTFSSNEYLIMKGNIIIFEDGVKVFFDDFIKGKEYLKEDWYEFE